MKLALVIIFGCTTLIFLFFVIITNSLNKSLEKIDEAESGIDIALTKRYDVLTKMLDTAKSFVKHEDELLIKTINLRSNASVKEKNETIKDMDESFRHIIAVAENYPDLKSSELFVNLQKSIADTEEHLQAARRAYNSNVSLYNQKIVTIPTSIVAKIYGFSKEDFFEADEAKKEDVKISL